MAKLTAKRRGSGPEMQTFKGQSGRVYPAIKTAAGGIHVLVETEAKDAAMDCGSPLPRSANTRAHWAEIWK